MNKCHIALRAAIEALCIPYARTLEKQRRPVLTSHICGGLRKETSEKRCPLRGSHTGPRMCFTKFVGKTSSDRCYCAPISRTKSRINAACLNGVHMVKLVVGGYEPQDC